MTEKEQSVQSSKLVSILHKRLEALYTYLIFTRQHQKVTNQSRIFTKL
jgi:hypothetical protein